MAWRREAPPTTPAPTLGIPPNSSKPDAWRKFVRAPVVEEAWARFAGSIVQEVRCRRPDLACLLMSSHAQHGRPCAMLYALHGLVFTELLTDRGCARGWQYCLHLQQPSHANACCC